MTNPSIADQYNGRINSGMFSSATDDWATPQYLFNELDREFGFTLDVCASIDNAKCAKYYSIEDDGLNQSWNGVCWMNPPYGREIGKWVKKAADTADRGGIVVCLVPARTDTRWWQQDAMRASEIRLIAGRVKFGNSNNSAPFPSAILIFGGPRYPLFKNVVIEEVSI